MSIILSLFCFSQNKNEISIQLSTKEAGKNLLSQKPIIGKEYILPERIQDFQIDTVNNYLTLQLRNLSKNGKWLENKGNVVRFDLEKNTLKWSKKITYQVESIEQYGGITIYSKGGKSYCLDNETGNQLWEVKNSVLFADPIEKIGLGYKIKQFKDPDNTLEGINLENGEVIWQRGINREYSWNDVFYINDSTLIIAAAGLHTLNVNDGKGWDYFTITGKKDYSASAVGTGLGLASALLTGYGSITTGYNLIRGIVSNIIIDSINIYFASKEKISKLDINGNVIWSTLLPDDLTSNSAILLNNDRLFMINKGYAFMGYRQLNFGTPFFAAFNLNTGEKIFLETISNEKKEFINDYDINGDTIFFVFNNRISSYSIENGILISNKEFDIEKYGDLKYFVGGHVFIKQDTIYASLLELNPHRYYLYTKSGKTLILNRNLETEGEINNDQFYVYYLKKGDFRFIAKENKTFILNPMGNVVAEISTSRESKFLNNKLFDKHENSFIEIDLGDLID